MSLDDKLKEIVLDNIQEGKYGFSRSGIEVMPDCIPKIKQAFVDEGYGTQQDWLVKSFNENYMTGQEWYDKFSKELCPVSPDGSTKNVHAYYSIDDIKSAAKKVSGL